MKTINSARPWVVAAGSTAAVTAALVAGGLVIKQIAGPELSVTTVRDGAVLGRAAAGTQTLIVVAGEPAKVRARLDGRPLALRVQGRRLVAPLGALAEGRHELSVTAPGSLPLTGGDIRRRFRVDATPPAVKVDGLQRGAGGMAPHLRARHLRQPFALSGRVQGAVRLTSEGRPVELDDGKFSLKYRIPPDAVRLTAYDRAGNRTDHRVPVVVPHPEMRAVHVTALAWASEPLRNRVLQMAREGRINAVQLDIKDEDGIVGYNSQVPLAREVKAARPIYDARKALDQLHAMNVRVVGRIVAFRDPQLGKASWRSGKRDRLVRTADGGAYGAHYGAQSFTNFANPEVRRYNIDLAVEAARLGFDDVLYDYVRRPDGPLRSMRFPGLKGSVEDSVASFVAETRRVVRPHGAFLGASVYGIAATRPLEIGQDIAKIGQHVDYVAPMLYPSHWGSGEFGIKNPDAEPYKTVHASMLTFHKVLRGTSAQVIPWLQDFTMGHRYGNAEVRAQIDAAAKTGSPSFLLWDPAVRYHPDALPRRATGKAA
ncbi:MAG TPA: putative glycoside hydrolase [Thermomonospora sp.]|nr:putative glycoside hydrolase [Thermomonospora sp.]